MVSRNIQLLATGGTIASRFSQSSQDVRVQSSAQDLIASIQPRLNRIAIGAEDVFGIPSFELEFAEAMELIHRVDHHLRRPDVDGVVVSHGTDTLEETALLADLFCDHGKPVVFTGSQRAADDPDSDGPRNLVDAINVAASPQSRDLGALVVFDGSIHLARDVAKTHTTRLCAFTSGELGHAGEVDGEQVLIYRHPTHQVTFSHRNVETRVDLVKLAMASDGRFIDCAIATGARGIVVEAFGRGNGTPAVLSSIRHAIAAGVKVVITSRCGNGRVAPMYGGSGGAALARAGALFGGALSGVKARIIVAVLLGRDDDGRDLAQQLAAFVD